MTNTHFSDIERPIDIDDFFANADFGQEQINNILFALYLQWNGNTTPEWQTFIDERILTVSLALGTMLNAVELKENGIRLMIDAYVDLCYVLDLDPYARYNSLNDMLVLAEKEINA